MQSCLVLNSISLSAAKGPCQAGQTRKHQAVLQSPIFCARAAMSSVVLSISQSASLEELKQHLASAVATGPNRVYLHLHDYAAPAATAELLTWLARAYTATSQLDPLLDVVPCLPFAGWTPDKVAELSAAAAPTSDAPPPTTMPSSVAAAAAKSEADAGTGPSTSGAAEASPQGSGSFAYSKVAVGGTFDRLHAGHRLLLAATALVATHGVFIGVTADELLARKAHKELLQEYSARCQAAVDFVLRVCPGLAISHAPLKDPQAPTQAELDPAMDALVVSEETLAGGEAINQGRLNRGFKPIQLVVVGLVGGGGSTKLSSTELRLRDAAAREKRGDDGKGAA